MLGTHRPLSTTSDLNTIAGTRTDPGGHLTEARTGAREAAAQMKDLAERFAELRNAVVRLPDKPSCDDRTGLRHRLLHLEHTVMSARGRLDDIIISDHGRKRCSLLTIRPAPARPQNRAQNNRGNGFRRALPSNVPAGLDQRAREFEESKEKGDAPKSGGRVSAEWRPNPIDRRTKMFDALPAIDTFTTQFDLDGTRDADPDYAAPLPDTGALLAAIGLPAHAIREVLGSRIYAGADG